MIKRVCKWCGKTFEPWIDGQILCSVECGHAWQDSGHKQKKECGYCGDSYYGNGNSKYCSKVCSAKAAAARPRKRIHIVKACLDCGKEFLSVSAGRRYCSDECKAVAMQRRAADRPKHLCECCGGEIKPNKSGHYSKYCSQECVSQALGKNKPRAPRPILQKTCVECGRPFETRNENKATCGAACHARQKGKNRFIPKLCVCQECGGVFMTEYGRKNRRYCSTECCTKAVKREGRLVRKIQLSRAYIERVSYREIYERDKGICGICGTTVVDARSSLDVWGATIDHIVPLSCGGEHSRDNCQLAHRGCNSLKSRGGATFKIKDIDYVAQKYGWRPRESL